jgi:hypothetical protein
LLRRHDLLLRQQLFDVPRHGRQQLRRLTQHGVDLDEFLGLPWTILAVPIRSASLRPSSSSAAHDGPIDAFLLKFNALAGLPFIGPRYKKHDAPPKFLGSTRGCPFLGAM